jgi:hypothetical protein
MVCCAIFSQDHKWYRALVKEIEELKKVKKKLTISILPKITLSPPPFQQWSYRLAYFPIVQWASNINNS